MADLSSVVDFTVLLDKSGDTPKIYPVDVSAYPLGTTLISGTFSVVQPDGVLVGSATEAVILRLSTDGSFQKGTYVFIYTVKAAGYDDTVKTKTFNLSYTPVKADIEDLTDVFTPSLQIIDATIYSKANYTLTVARAWSAVASYIAGNQQVITGTAALFDMVYATHYYDAHYDITLVTTLTYAHSNGWFSLKDKITTVEQMDVYTPPALTTLLSSLQTMRKQIAEGTYCGGCGCKGDYEPFEKAQALYSTLVQSGQNSVNLDQLGGYVTQLQKLFNCSGIIKTPHTNDIITPYSWGAATGNGGGTTAHAPVQFTVGSGNGFAPTDEATDYDNTDLKNYTIKLIYLNAIGDFLDPSQWANKVTGGFRLIGRTFTAGEKYTLTFADGGASTAGMDGVIITAATGERILMTGLMIDGAPTVTYTVLTD